MRVQPLTKATAKTYTESKNVKEDVKDGRAEGADDGTGARGDRTGPAKPPGQSRTWTFALPPCPPEPEPAIRIGVPAEIRDPRIVLVQFKCDSSIPGAAEISATVELQAGALNTLAEVRAMPGTVQNLVFRAFPADARTAAVTFHNRGGHEATLFFDPAASPSLPPSA